MRTPPMSDEELDDVVRRAAEAYSDEVPLGSWLSLEDRLNEAAMLREVAQRVNRRVARLFVLEVLLVALALLWWQGGGQLPAGEKRPVARVTAVASPVAPAAAVTRAAGTRRRRAPAETAALSELAGPPLASAAAQAPTAPAQAAGADPRNDAAVAARPQVPLLPITPVAPERHTGGHNRGFPPGRQPNKERRFPEPASFVRGQKPAQTTSAATTPNPEKAASLTGTDAAAKSSPAEVTSPATPVPALVTPGALNSSATATVAAPAPVLPAPAPADSLPPKAKRERPAYRLLVGVLGAPELTAVRTSELTRPGSTLGAIVEYRLPSRLRVRSGLLRSVKLYSARGKDYKPPAGYWTWRVPIDRIDANCLILEIPLDLRYDLVQRPTYSLFASAGITSLLMRNEEYTYGYESSGQYKKYTRYYPRGGSHALSVLNLSVGYERALTPRWAAQAEPFVKLPLGGVGFGKIHLRSAGVSLGLKYGLLRPRPAP